MFEQLINIGRELEPALREFFSEGRFSKIIRGVSIDVDNYWEQKELMENLYDDKYFRYPWYGRYENSQDDNLFWQILRLNRTSSNSRVNFSYRPHDWSDYCLQMGYPKDAQPIRILVTLYEIKDIYFSELPRSFGNYPIIYEKRPPNKANRGLTTLRWLRKGFRRLRGIPENRALAIKRLNPFATGTGGGILQGFYSGKTYLISCGHVMGDVGTEIYEQYGKGQKLGEVVYHKMPPLCFNPESGCSEETHSDFRSVDVAVAELTLPIEYLITTGVIIKPSRIAQVRDMRQNQIVSFTGKKSGKVNAKIGPLTLWDKVSFPDGQRCFGRIFELTPVNRQYVRQDLAQPGDSGSFVVQEIDTLVLWQGVVISCDGGKVYACFAQYITDSWYNDLPEPLRCFP